MAVILSSPAKVIASNYSQADVAVLPVGTPVTFPFGVTKRVGTIVEYRGEVGAGKRPMYRIEFLNDDETYSIELPASEFTIEEALLPEPVVTVSKKS